MGLRHGKLLGCGQRVFLVTLSWPANLSKPWCWNKRERMIKRQRQWLCCVDMLQSLRIVGSVLRGDGCVVILLTIIRPYMRANIYVISDHNDCMTLYRTVGVMWAGLVSGAEVWYFYFASAYTALSTAEAHKLSASEWCSTRTRWGHTSWIQIHNKALFWDIPPDVWRHQAEHNSL